MKITNATTAFKYFKRFLLTSCALASIVLTSCDGVGLFATVAVSEKIEQGSLPEGLSASTVVNAAGGLLTLNEYDFFSGGVALWARNNLSTSNKWFKVGLVDDNGTRWDGVQSIAASNTQIWLALIKVSGTSVQVGLATVTHDGSNLQITRLAGPSTWSSTSSGYTALKLFRPDPATADTVYVNVINYSGTFGERDDNNLDVTSSLFSIAGISTDWTAAGTTDSYVDDELDGTNGRRYVTGIADNGSGTVLISATTSKNDSAGGILMDDNGAPSIDYSGSNVAVTGVTWLDNLNAGTGAFIMAGTAFLSGNRPIFASVDGGVSWTIIGQTSGSYTIQNFVDISNTTAGANVVLAGTQSVYEDSTSEPSGYFEIDVTDADPANWILRTSISSFTFADQNNYSSSDLTDASILGMSFGGGPSSTTLYVGTSGKGLWAIDAAIASPSWHLE